MNGDGGAQSGDGYRGIVGQVHASGLRLAATLETMTDAQARAKGLGGEVIGRVA